MAEKAKVGMGVNGIIYEEDGEKDQEVVNKETWDRRGKM